MITKDDLFVQGERIASVAEIRAGYQGALVESLRAALKRPMLVGKEMSPSATLPSARSPSWRTSRCRTTCSKRVMATCTDADYGKISLAVMQKEKPVVPGRFKPAA